MPDDYKIYEIHSKFRTLLLRKVGKAEVGKAEAGICITEKQYEGGTQTTEFFLTKQTAEELVKSLQKYFHI